MENYFLDTNIFLRYFVEDDPRFFPECKKLIKKINSGEITASTSTLVLSEIYFVLKSYFHYPKRNITEILASILKMEGLKITDNYNPLYALELFEAYKIKFVDCLIASIEPIKNQRMILVSFDKEFDKIKIKRILPRQILESRS